MSYSPSPPLTSLPRLIGVGLLLAAWPHLVGCTEREDPGRPGGALPSSDGGAPVAPGAGGGGSAASDPTGGIGGAPPAQSAGPCPVDVAFRAAGLSFTEPTAPALGMALGAALYGYEAHGISLVVHGDTLTASATVAGDDGAHVLIGSPAFTGAVVSASGIRAEGVQATGLLRVHDGEWPVDLDLINVTLDARTSDDCSQVFVVLDAILPIPMAGVALGSDEESMTIGELGGGAAPETQGFQLRALFIGEAIDFDFESLAP